MKAIVFVVLISIISVIYAQPSLEGTWVSDSCEPIPGRTQGFNYWYVRTYTFEENFIRLETKIYQNTCAANNLQAKVVSDGVFAFGGLSEITPGCDLNNTESAVYDMQVYFNTSRTITPSTTTFAISFGSFCSVELVNGVTTDITTLDCQLFQFFYPCAQGEHDVITVIEADGTNPKRFYNGVRTNVNVCQLLNRPTQLATNGCVFEGTGVATTPLTCTAYVAPVAPPVAVPVAVPVTPPTPKKSIGSIVFSSSILVLAAGVVAFF
jgi:hypothetical protein